MADQPSEASKTKWRRRLGLAPSTPDPEEWVQVTSGRVDNAHTGYSNRADTAVQILSAAGVESEQRRFVIPDASFFGGMGAGSRSDAPDRVRVGVFVHRRNLDRAQAELGPHHQQSDEQFEPISDEELARLSEEAGRQAGDGGAG